MTAHAEPLGVFDLALAAALVLVCGVFSLLLKLGMERRLGWAFLRMTVQLVLIGLVLQQIFALESPWAVSAIAALMILVAGRNAAARPTRTFDGATGYAFVTLIVAGLLTTLYGTRVVVGVEPWYRPQYVIPMLGMVLGNSLNGLSLSLDHMLETLALRRDQVEADLAMGATAWEAAREPMAEAVRRGMIPTVNAMTVMGLVALPGMMTGQILGGEPPLEAVKYQILIMCMIAGAVASGCILLCLLTYRRLFNARHQLLAGAIRKR